MMTHIGAAARIALDRLYHSKLGLTSYLQRSTTAFQSATPVASLLAVTGNLALVWMQLQKSLTSSVP